MSYFEIDGLAGLMALWGCGETGGPGHGLFRDFIVFAAGYF